MQQQQQVCIMWWVVGVILSMELFPSYQCHLLGADGKGEGKQSLRQIIYCTFLKHGEPVSKPPTLNHIRVSRGPDDGSYYYYNPPTTSDVDYEEGTTTRSKSPQIPSTGGGGGVDSLLLPPLYPPIKSPSYQHKMNHISQFHTPPTHPYSSDVTFSLRPTSSNAVYPVASVMNAKGDTRRGPIYQSTLKFDNDFIAADDPQSPTFTPYIGSRILSNIPKFFQHLHENIKAIHDSTELLPDDSSISLENAFKEESMEKQVPAIAASSRRGDYFQSDGRLSVDVEEGDEGGYRYTPTDDLPSRNSDPTGEYASKDMLAFMGRDPKYKKANNYNPAWLFTNLGLGKRSVHFPQPHSSIYFY